MGVAFADSVTVLHPGKPVIDTVGDHLEEDLMNEATRTTRLPSGKQAEVRKGKGRDSMRAHRAVAGNAEPMSVSFALIAELAHVDGKPLVYEDILEMDLDDVLALEAEVTGAGEGRENFPEPAVPQRETLSAADLTGLIAFGFSHSELGMMTISELSFWAKAVTDYLSVEALIIKE